MGTDRKIKSLVVDTAAFIKAVPLWEYGEELYCIREVIREIRDRQTRNAIDRLPIPLKFREPSPESIKFINDFTKKTGDFASLSLVDVKILALTYDLEKEAKGGISHLRSEPVKQRTTEIISCAPVKNEGFSNIEGFYMPSQNEQFENLPTANNEDSSTSPYERKKEEKVEEKELYLSTEHLKTLNNHFSLYAYVGGYTMTGKDAFLLFQLESQFPLLQELSKLKTQHIKGGQLHLMLDICKGYSTKLSVSEEAEDSRKQLNIKDECTSMRIAKKFSWEYGKWSHIVRWFLHMLTFDETELKNVQNLSSFSLSLREIFESLTKLNDTELNNSGSKNGENIGLSSIDEKEDDEAPLQSEHPVPVVPSQNEEDPTTDAVQSDEGIESEEEYEDESDEETEEEEEESEEDEEESEEDEEESEEEDEGWITPSNLRVLKQKNRNLVEETPSDVQVACITADYAMQNTLKHIGLHVMGVDGKLIKSLRTFILRCFGCFKTTDKMEQLFCGHCGHKTLKKVSVTMNPDGTQKIWISSRKPISIRGTKFSLPRPKGGKYSINPILVADQREAQQRVTRLSRIKNNPLHEDYEARAGVSPFLTRDVYSRSAQLGLKTGKKGHRGLFYWEQKNPNVPLSKGTTRKKRR